MPIKIRKKQYRENTENEIFEKQLIEFEELTNELLSAIDQHTGSGSYNKGNLEIEHAASFNFEKAIDINSLSGDQKTISEIIIENADEYKWRYA